MNNMTVQLPLQTKMLLSFLQQAHQPLPLCAAPQGHYLLTSAVECGCKAGQRGSVSFVKRSILSGESVNKQCLSSLQHV